VLAQSERSYSQASYYKDKKPTLQGRIIFKNLKARINELKQQMNKLLVDKTNDGAGLSVRGLQTKRENGTKANAHGDYYAKV
jgi:hypothetical protein